MIRTGLHKTGGAWPEGAVRPPLDRQGAVSTMTGPLAVLVAPPPDLDFCYIPEPILAVTCWCERKVVDVPAREVRALRTRSCGRDSCDG